MASLVLEDLAGFAKGDLIFVEHCEKRGGGVVVLQRPYYFSGTRQGWLDVYRSQVLNSAGVLHEEFKSIPFSAIYHVKKC